MSTLQTARRLDTLNLTRLPLTNATGRITLRTVNGQAQGTEAFVARVGFRDDDGMLILPPYADFGQLLHGFSGFYVSGGSPDAPALTQHDFVAPAEARTIEIEVRRNKCPEPPQVATGPDLVATRAPLPTAPIYQMAMTEDVTAIEVEVINGQPAGKKAFIGCVRFFDEKRDEILPPHSGFARSPVLGSYFYLPGGTRTTPARMKREFTPPRNAVTMEVKLCCWDMREPIALSAPPRVARRANVATPAAGAASENYLGIHISSAPMGSQILSQTVTADRVVGIMGETLRQALGDRAAQANLPFDRYETAWGTPVPGTLLIEAEALSQAPGWEHALTLRDPPATVELAAMLHKARAAGIKTVLVVPHDSHRFPMVSHVAALFDEQHTPEALLAQTGP